MSQSVLLRGRHDLMAHILSYIDVSAADLSDILIVFPGKRPSHFLRKAIAERKQTSFIPPRIFSMDVFVEFLYSERLGYHTKPIEPIESAGLLYRWFEDRIAGAVPGVRHVEDFVPFGLRMVEDLEEMRIHGLSPKRLAQTVADLPLPETHVLKDVYSEFYRRLEAEGLSTRASRYRTVADNMSLVHLAEYRRVILAGFFGPTASEVDIFRSLISKENVVFVFQDGPGMERHLKSLHLRPDVIDQPEIRSAVQVFKAGDTHGQVFGFNAVLAEWSKSNPWSENAAVVLSRPESLFPVLRQTDLAARQPDEEYNIAVGYPIIRTPIFGFFQSLFDLLSSRHRGMWHIADYVKFILHPYTKNIRLGKRTGVTRILFHTIEEFLVEDAGRAYVDLGALEGDAGLFDRVGLRLKGLGDPPADVTEIRDHLIDIHTHLLRRFDSIDTVQRLAEACRDVLLYVSETSTAHRHPLFAKFCDEFLSALEDLGASAIGELSCRDLQGYWSLAVHHLAARRVPFPGTPLKGLQVLDLLETRNLRFDSVFLLDANDDCLPGVPSSGSFLPTRVRETVGLPTYHEREMTSRYYFHLLVQGADNVHVFFIEEGRKERSRFVERILWEEEKTTGEAPPVRALNHPVRLQNNLPRPVAKTPELVEYLRGMTYSPTSLNAYLTCPIRFYYAHALRLREKEQIDVEPDHFAVGLFVHRVLAEYFAPCIGEVLTEERLDEQALERLVEERFDETFGRENTAGRMIMKRQISSQLASFLRNYQKPVANSRRVVVLALEEKLQCQWNGYNLTGVVDRVEARDGRTFLLDYKTGSEGSRNTPSLSTLDVEDRATWRKGLRSTQLPIYQILYSNVKGVAPDQIIPAYVFLGKQTLDEEIEQPLHDQDVPDGDSVRLESVLVRLLNELTDAETPFVPTDKIQEDCPECPFKYVCGTQWTRGRD